MSVRLNQPLASNPNADELAMLSILQGNILKSHGRKATAHVFLRFDSAQVTAARTFLRMLGTKLTPASVQLGNAAKIRTARRAGKAAPTTPPFLACMLSAGGYAALGLGTGATPTDPAFRDGLKSRGEVLNDPPVGKWDAGYRSDIHAMILIGGDPDKRKPGKSKQVDDALASLLDTIPLGAVQVLGIERGRAYHNEHDDGIEHFGYVDGRSQPLLREDDINAEAAHGDGIVRWDPAFPIKQVLVKDPAVANAFGSYFVFRKLEQNVKGFKEAEEVLGKKLQKLAKQRGQEFDPELAGAMIVGRFEDGTPILLQHGEGMHNPVPNDFDYSGDPDGLKCPFHAHIRKTNPRGDTARIFGVPLEEERAHIMARRGIPYGTRKQNKKMEFIDKPNKGVGLLFMAYQSDIENQFEFTQRSWANSEGFVRPDTGIDPVIGQGGTGKQTHRAGWGDAAALTHQTRFADFVTMKGGEYFFAPSISFFEVL
jgi:Dyp-type peroxidase family